LGSLYRKFVFPVLPPGTAGKRYLYNLTLSEIDRYLDSISYLPADGRERSLFSADYLHWVDQQESPVADFRRYLQGRGQSHKCGLSTWQYLDFKTYLPSDILTKVDRMSMANSLEVRAPLLDQTLIEWASRIPPEYRIRQGERKYILKKLGLHLGVPREAIYRRKQGFSMPLVRWIKTELREQFLDVLADPVTAGRGYFRPQAVKRMLDEHFTSRRDHSGTLWQLLVFELWHRNFLGQFAKNSAETASVCV